MAAPGQVIVFNCFSEPMTMFSLNGTDMGAIAGWNMDPNALLYTPAGIAVPRSVDAGGGRFFEGTNKVIVNWMGETFHFEVAIDGGQHPLVESLALLVLRSGYSLLNAFGVLIAAGSLEAGPALGAPTDSAPTTP